MRPTEILVPGCGYGALCAATALLNLGASVRLLAERTPEAYRDGPVRSSQSLFGPAPAAEEALGLRAGIPPGAVPPITTGRVAMLLPESPPMIQWDAPVDPPGASIDQRDVLDEGLRRFAEHGGRVEVPDWPDEAAIKADLAQRASQHDLVVVTSGRIGRIVFGDDPAFGPPAVHRQLRMAYVRGAQPDTPDPGTASITVVAPNPATGRPYGELVTFPAYSHGSQVTIVLMEAVPGGMWDDPCAASLGPDELWAHMQDLMKAVPAAAERFAAAEVTDPGGVLTGGVRQGVRYPLTRIGDTPAVAAGDAWMTLDPVGTRGAWNALLHAVDLANALRPGVISMPVLRDFIRQVTPRTLSTWRFTNSLLAPPASVQAFLAQAQGNSAVRRLFLAGIADPSNLEGSAFYGVDPTVAQAT